MPLVDTIRAGVKAALPEFVLDFLRERRDRRSLARAIERSEQRDRALSQLPTQEVFTKIYRDQLWGDKAGFYSGMGSHATDIVEPYVAAVRGFVAAHFPSPPDAVDLGCGDFNVGRQIRSAFARYTACDIVPDLIARNTAEFAPLGVEFRCVDITAQDPPAGDVAMVRQVLQHLSNAQIRSALPKLSRFRWVIVTEHLPLGAFEPNVDKPTGTGVRLVQKKPSGVVLTEPPFSIQPHEEIVLCTVPDGEDRGIIRTIAYRFEA